MKFDWLVPRVPEKVPENIYRLGGKVRIFVLTPMLICTILIGVYGTNWVGLNSDFTRVGMSIYSLLIATALLLSIIVWRFNVSLKSLRTITYVIITLELATSLLNSWALGIRSSYFMAGQLLIYRAAYDLRIGVYTLATIVLGLSTIVGLETIGLLQIQPAIPSQFVDYPFNSKQSWIAVVFIIMLLSGIFFSTNWMILRIRNKELALRLLRQSMMAASPERCGQHTGRVFGESYMAQELIGGGGMGEVYAGTHCSLERKAAIKVLHAHLLADPTHIKRFMQEAEIASKLGSPHLVEVFDVDVQDGQPFIAMELLEGQDLKARIEKDRKMELWVVAQIIEQAASGLAVAHAANIVHRDLKPANIFLTEKHGEITVMILDFGVSKIHGLTTELTCETALLGTPAFMSPEQARGTPVDQRTDIFAMGVIAYNALAGQPPFRGDSVPSVLMRICENEPYDLLVLRPDLPPDVADVIAIAMAKHLVDRYKSMEELAKDFALAVRGELGEDNRTKAKQLRQNVQNALKTRSADSKALSMNVNDDTLITKNVEPFAKQDKNEVPVA